MDGFDAMQVGTAGDITAGLPLGPWIEALAQDLMKRNELFWDEQGTQDIAEKGLMVQTVICDSHGKPVKVQRINPSIKIQREALRTIGVLKRQIERLQKEVQASEKPVTALDLLAPMKKEKHDAAKPYRIPTCSVALTMMRIGSCSHES